MTDCALTHGADAHNRCAVRRPTAERRAAGPGMAGWRADAECGGMQTAAATRRETREALERAAAEHRGAGREPDKLQPADQCGRPVERLASGRDGLQEAPQESCGVDSSHSALCAAGWHRATARTLPARGETTPRQTNVECRPWP